jgi:RNA polymerase sigma factor (TIGR02999 family)
MDWKNRAHFFAMASKAMRRVLVDHARGHGRVKRGGDWQKLELDGGVIYEPERSWELVALDDALDQLAEWDPRQSQIVEMRFFGGLTEEEIAEALGTSSRTVKREWAFAKAWLWDQIVG